MLHEGMFVQLVLGGEATLLACPVYQRRNIATVVEGVEARLQGFGKGGGIGLSRRSFCIHGCSKGSK